MRNILAEIAAKTRERIAAEEQKVSVDILKEKIKNAKPVPDFYDALKRDGMSFICEVKKASPSKGIIAEDFPYVRIAKEYEEAGAAAVSCLTEPYWFMGTDSYLEEIADNISIPILRKDFTVNSYMVYQARAIGASAILLICSILTDEELRQYRELAEQLGMNALVETHDEEEITRAIRSGAKIIGVNNRNLKTFTVDLENSINLRKMVGPDIVFVSESGIRNSEDIKRLYDNHVDAVLIGETLMRAVDKKKMLEELGGGICH